MTWWLLAQAISNAATSFEAYYECVNYFSMLFYMLNNLKMKELSWAL